MLNPATLLIVGLILGAGGAVTYTTFHYAEKASPKLTLADLRPSLPWEGLPLPRFVYTKSELLQQIMKED